VCNLKLEGLSREKLIEFVVQGVNERLRAFFDELYREVELEAVKARDIVDAAKEFTLRGGKRLRAVLALVGYWSREWGSGSLNSIMDVMAAIELLQSYLLVHDDIMDRDEVRRGGPTTHVVFREICRKHGWSDCGHYGISQAITTGDYLEALAVGLLASKNIDPVLVPQLVSTYTRGLRLVAYGQYLDVLFSKLPLRNVGEEDITLVYKLKTSSYTIELPLHLGAIASGKHNDRLLRELSEYANPAGVAFQIRDDIIGLYGDPSVTGKPAGSDVKGKKKTLLVIKAYEYASSDDRKLLELVYDKMSEEEITDEYVERVREIVKTTGALEYCEKTIKNNVEKALGVLRDSKEISSEAKEFLEWLTYKLAYREK